MSNKRKRNSSKICSTDETSVKQIKWVDDKNLDKLVEKVEKLYGIKMPKDFKYFWKLCLEIEPKNPLGKTCISLILSTKHINHI